MQGESRRSHTDEEIRHIEKTYNLIFDHWEVAGGRFLYEAKPLKGPAISLEENAGLEMLVPVFRSNKEAGTVLKEVETKWKTIG